MEIGRSSNPTLSKNTFTSVLTGDNSAVMTLSGTINKTFILLLLVTLGAAITWKMVFDSINVEVGIQQAYPWIIGGMVGGLILALVTIFKKNLAYITAPAYAVFEGLFLGATSAMFEFMYPGIVLQAVGLTFGVLFLLLFAYKTKLIKVTENFRLGVFAATGAIGLMYLVSFILGMFGIHVGFIHDNGWMSIGISVVIVVIASLNLILDFDFIEKGSEQGAPKYMEWYAAFGLMVTLIWLYIEILRLLSKLRSR